MCDQFTIIREGRTVEAGTLAELRHLTTTSVDVTTIQPLGDLLSREGVTDAITHSPTRATFSITNEDLGSMMSALAGLGIQAIESQPPPWNSCSCATTP